MIHAHSGLRWIVLVGLIVAVIVAIMGLTGNKAFTEKTRKIALIAFIGSHIQLLLGLVLMFTSGKVNLGKMMASDQLRFFTLEHPFMMIIAIALITLGYMKSKRAESDNGKYKALAVYYGIALLLILIAIPWPFREALGAGWA